MRTGNDPGRADSVVVIIASAGRPSSLGRILKALAHQTRAPDRVIVVVPDRESEPPPLSGYVSHVVLRSERGSCRQRNVGLDFAQNPSVVLFFDDDALPRPDYIERACKVLADRRDVVGVTGRVALDGVPLKRALTQDEMIAALESSSAEEKDALQQVDGLYGCNMAVRGSALEGLRFDERLPAYGWLEDLDLSRQLLRKGRLVRANQCVAVHQGNTLGGRGKHARFGYSAIANPLYLLRKGSVTLRDLPYLVGRPVLANLRGAVHGGDVEWRRERLRGMTLALGDALRGRLRPERAAEL